MADMAAKPLAAAAIAQLESDGVATLIGTVVNPAGLIHAKTVPLRRMSSFADPGLGASPVWHVFAIDQAGIVFSESTGVVGDQRIRIDLGALRILGNGFAWAPGSFFDQNGEPDPYCTRGALAAVTKRLDDAGYSAVVGHEIEFVLVGPDGARLPQHLWAQYGLAGVLEYEGFVRDVTAAATSSGMSESRLCSPDAMSMPASAASTSVLTQSFEITPPRFAAPTTSVAAPACKSMPRPKP